MSKESKTARASAVTAKVEKKVISDEQYIKNLRNDLDAKLYVSQEGARALLGAYDKLLDYTRSVEQRNLDNSGYAESLVKLATYLSDTFPNDFNNTFDKAVASSLGQVAQQAVLIFKDLLLANKNLAALVRSLDAELKASEPTEGVYPPVPESTATGIEIAQRLDP
jgi:hypothetical protein